MRGFATIDKSAGAAEGRSPRCSEKDRRSSLLTVLALAAVLPGLLLAGGCSDDETLVAVDLPPAVPTGVYSVTGDEVVTVFWNYNSEEDIGDLAGYDVYRNDPQIHDEGDYYYLGSVAYDENFIVETLQHYFQDADVTNGHTYYYAVLAYDSAGNESDLSFEFVFDTPRPEGSGVVLYDRAVSPDRSGFDFSMLDAGRTDWDSPMADIFVEFEAGVPYVVSARPDVVKIQDYGTIPLVWVDYAPVGGYSATGRLELITGHSYIVKISAQVVPGLWVEHFAKFEILGAAAPAVTIEWAYQTDDDNPELSVPETPAPAADEIGKAEVVRF